MTLATIFPSIPQTVWKADDPALQLFNPDGLLMRGPHIDLDIGMYGVEYQVEALSELTDPDLPLAIATFKSDEPERKFPATPIFARSLMQAYAGMYGGIRLTLMLERPARKLEFFVIRSGSIPLKINSFKLVPRPGRIWFPAECDHNREMWKHQADRSSVAVKSTLLRSPAITLDPGEYRVGVKMTPPPGAKGVIAQIGAVSAEGLITELTPVTAEEMFANFGIPEAKLRFRLDMMRRYAAIRVQALVRGLRVEWIRLATADESVWQHYYNMGGLTSPLGRPISAFVPDEPSRGYVLGSVRRFEDGAIYWTIDHGPCEVFGALWQQFEEKGGTAHFGFPISRPKRVRLEDGREELRQEYWQGRQNVTLTVQA